MKENIESNFQYLKFWRLIGWLLVAGICFFSLVKTSGGEQSFEYQDKILHFGSYALLSFFHAQVYQDLKTLWLIVIISLMGVVLEFAQAQVGYRNFEYIDMLANLLGALFGVLMSYLFPALLKSIDKKLSFILPK